MDVRRVIFEVLIAIAFALTSVSGRAATMHLIIAADTEDLTIGTGVKQNEKSVVEYFRVVAKKLSMTPGIPVFIDGADFHKNNGACIRIQNAISALNVAADDVAVFYYAAHGFNDGKRQFPDFTCDGTNKPFYGLLDAADALAKRGPHLVLGIADTCNKPAHVAPRALPYSAAPIDDLPALRRLFVDSKGVVLLAAAAPEHWAYYLDTGGFFTNQLLVAISNELPLGAAAGWADLAKRSKKPMDVIYKGKVIDTQTPIADLSRLQAGQVVGVTPR